MVTVVALAVWWVGRTHTTGAGTIRALRQLTNSGAADLFPSFSPDGSQIVFSSNRTGRFELYIRSLALGSDERQITFGGQDAIQPAWSPDGQSLAFSFKGGGIAVMPASGGAVRYLAESGSGPQWSPDGRMLVYSSFNGDSVLEVDRQVTVAAGTYLMLVRADGSEAPRQLKYPGDPMIAHSNARWVDERHVLFVAAAQIWAIDPWAGQLMKVDLGDRRVEFFAPSPDGHTLYFGAHYTTGQRGLWKTQIDRNWRAQRTEPLMPAAGPLPAGLAVSRDGSRLAFSQEIGLSGLWTVPVDPAGIARGEPKVLLQDSSMRNMEPDFSEDGFMLAYTSLRQGEQYAVYVINADGSALRRISPVGVGCHFPRWLDSGRCAFFCGTGEIWVSPLRGPAQRVNHALKLLWWPHMTRDGARLVTHYREAPSRRRKLVVEDLRTGEIRDLTSRDRSVGFPVCSPDARWVAAEEEHGHGDALVVVSMESGRIETLVDEPVHSWPHSWAPNNDQIAFAGLRDGLWNIYWVSRSTRRVQQLTYYQSRSGYVRYPAWSPRGNQVVFERNDLVANIYLADLR